MSRRPPWRRNAASAVGELVSLTDEDSNAIICAIKRRNERVLNFENTHFQSCSALVGKKDFGVAAGKAICFKHAHNFVYQWVIKNSGLFRANSNTGTAAYTARGRL